jgi:hypothetical protein
LPATVQGYLFGLPCVRVAVSRITALKSLLTLSQKYRSKLGHSKRLFLQKSIFKIADSKNQHIKNKKKIK